MQTDAIQVMGKHGKSFRFAGMFLGTQTLNQAARLYRFCRWIDDIADDATDKQQAKEQLLTIQKDLREQKATSATLGDFLMLQQEVGIETEHAICLVDGVISDMSDVALETMDELIQYAYRVAGVVGLMMCPILKAEKAGYAHAVDLGIAMQLTNIARDVKEDALMGRRYLPAQFCPVSAQDIAYSTQPSVRLNVQYAISSLLEVAEQYYKSARQGYIYLPTRNRRAIAVAANVYRAIGIQLEHNKNKYWRGRSVVATHKKLWIAGKTLLSTEPQQKSPHDDTLHQALRSMYVSS